jgi:AcrR family transcriptional regulator
MSEQPPKSTRPYRQQRRAEQQVQTRQKVVDAVLALHGEVGPAFTTVSAIAERAGVERVTVYRYFPDDLSLFSACGARFHEVHPLPETATWRHIANPVERLRAALAEVYAYHAATEPIQGNFRRDAPRLPALQQVVARAVPHWRKVTASLLSGWPEGGEPALLTAAIGHALDFMTWRDLVRIRGLSQEQAIQMMVRFVACTSQGQGDTVDCSGTIP